MTRIIGITIVCVAASISSQSAHAGWLASIYHGITDGPTHFFHTVARDTKRCNCWPYPFVVEDRRAARAPFAQMIANGWERQNMLTDGHFDARTQELTISGRMKVHWIVNDAPKQHRVAYVRATTSPEATARRIDHVQQYAARLIQSGNLPPIQTTTISPQDWPADYVDAMDNAFKQSTPSPRLPGNGS